MSRINQVTDIVSSVALLTISYGFYKWSVIADKRADAWIKISDKATDILIEQIKNKQKQFELENENNQKIKNNQKKIAD